ncbi:MAG: sugar phosphate isomerase/epimerase [Lentisphaerae bacterium]|nr:sugar phosphate isomerase/epimerase [Lentisphaerota bacterium]
MDLERISCCTYPVRDHDLDHTFRLLAGIGFQKADLWGGPPNYSNDPAECNIASLASKATAYSLRIANLGTYAGRRLLEDGEDAEWLEMSRAIDNAKALGARSIRVCPGRGEDPAIVPSLVPFFRRAAAYAASQGVYLGMENHMGSIAGNPAAVMRLVRAVDSPHFGILFEPANLMQCGVDCRAAYAAFRGWIVHVHVKDAHIRDGAYERTMLGEGVIDYAWVVGALEADGYAGDYALEYEIEKQTPIAEGLPLWLSRFRDLQPLTGTALAAPPRRP